MLIFDFDGVLVNSVDEVTVNAWNTVTESLATSLEELPEGLIALFQRNRFLAPGAPDIFSLMDWCRDHFSQADGHTLSPAEFQSILAGEKRSAEERRERFFSTRRRFVEENRPAWLALNRPYQPLWDALLKKGGDRVVLLTTKNRAAAGNLCRHFGLEIPEENIYSGDGGATKIENMNRIHERFERPAYSFVDDNIANLRLLDDHFNRDEKFLRLLLASWGYAGPDDRGHALDAGYGYLAQEDLIEMLDRELAG